MNRCDVLRKITDDLKLAELIYELSQKAGNKEALNELMVKPLTKEELREIRTVALSNYPLSLSGIQ